jgi:hypothetical protein
MLILVLAGVLQLAIAAANLPLSWLLRFGREHRRLSPIVRQIHEVHHVYIVALLGIFGAISLAFPDELSGGGGLGRFLSAVLALFWGGRLLVQRFYYDRVFLGTIGRAMSPLPDLRVPDRSLCGLRRGSLEMKKDLVIAVTGSHGFVGSALVARLRAQGHTVIPLPREIGLLPGCDVLIHLAGESPAGYWTARKRRAIYNSRVLGTRRLVSRLRDAVSLPKVFLCASAVGFYGHRPGEPLDETSAPGRGFRADTCLDWEAEAMKAEALGIRTVRLRFGTILDPSGGYLGRMLPLLRHGLCFVLGDPEDRFSWISLGTRCG